jgi:phosphoribosylformylglycinamidine synthase
VGQKFTSVTTPLRLESTSTAWTNAYDQGQEISIVLKNGEGNYQADAETIRQLEDEGRVVVRYLDNPNGSVNDIAGITNERGNVVGLMPHPEHNVDPTITSDLGGQGFFQSLEAFLSR